MVTKEFSAFGAFLFWVVIVNFLFRLVELWKLTEFSTLQSGLLDLISKGLLFDLLNGFIFYLPFFFALILIKKQHDKFVYYVNFLYLLLVASASNFFVESHSLLDHVVLNYNWNDVVIVLKSAFRISTIGVIITVTSIILVVILIKALQKIKFYSTLMLLFIGVIVGAYGAIDNNLFVDGKPDFGNELEYGIKHNKISYFVYQLVTHEKSTEQIFEVNDNVDVDVEQVKVFKNTYDKKFSASDEFPILLEGKVQNSLGKYFSLKEDKPPNVVIVLMESIGRSVSGKGARLGSFTPFLDSLADHSLYWENCISTCERTFNVIPAVLSSSPHGEYGFCSRGINMPLHRSLFSELKNSGYKTSFQYGGNLSFSHMDDYMKMHNVDFVLNNKKFNGGKENKVAGSWGWTDKEIFKRGINQKNIDPSDKPTLDVFLTLSSHQPFIVPEDEKYDALFQKRILKNEYKSSKEKKAVIQLKEKMKCVMYTDDAIRGLVNKYKKRPGFNNTIFVFVADHNMGPIPHPNPLNKYHVPLVIYSPLLKSSKRIKSIVSHLDITPSLLSLIGSKYQINERPQSWLGTALATNTKFEAKYHQAFIKNNSDILEYIDDHYYYNEGTLYEINENLDVKKSINLDKLNEIERKFKAYCYVNSYVTKRDKLLPVDSEKETVFNFNSSFKEESKYFKSERITGQGNTDKCCLLMNRKNKYPSIVENFKIKKGFTNGVLKTSFVFKPIKTKRKSLPSIVLKILHDDTVVQSLYRPMKKIIIDSIVPGSWNKLSSVIPIRLDSKKSYEVKLYLYNPRKGKMYYDDVSVKLESYIKEEI